MYHGITTLVYPHICPNLTASKIFSELHQVGKRVGSPQKPLQAFPERFPHGAKFGVTSTIAEVTLIVVPARPQAADHWPLAIEESAISRARALYGVFFFKGRSLC